MLVAPPKLTFPCTRGKYPLDPNACNVQVECVLLWEQPGGTAKQVESWSRLLTKAEQTYSTTPRDCIAIVWTVFILRKYIEGTRFKIRTHRESLKWIFTLSVATSRLDRWQLHPSKFDFVVVYRTGIKYRAADALSRLTATGRDQESIANNLQIAMLETEPQNGPNVCLVTNVATLPDEANIRPVNQVVDDNGAEEDEAASTLQEFLHHQAMDVFYEQAAEILARQMPGCSQ